MLYRETLENGFIHTYSDTFKIRQFDTGIVYDDAIDVVNHEYVETDILLSDDTEAVVDDYQSALRDFGVRT